MTRTTMKNIRALVTAVLLCGAFLGGCSERGLDKPKNILIICLDTVRADTFFGLANSEHDALSSWEKKAIVFENAQSAAPWTVPSIASVFTGLWPAQHGAGLFSKLEASILRDTPSKMYSNVTTLASAAKSAGYQTAAVSASAWTAGKKVPTGLTRGFDSVTNMVVVDHQPDWRPLVDTWQQLLPQQAGKENFFHYLHLMEAHDWHARGPDVVDKYYRELTAKQREQYLPLAPGEVCQNPEAAMCKRFLVYTSAVAAQREGVARTLEVLEQKNLLDDTVVVVFSDHGEEFLDHLGDARVVKKYSEDARFRDFVDKLYSDVKGEVENFYETVEAFGHGRTLYQEMLHVPLLVWHPGIKGEAVTLPTSLIDVAPSLARWTGLPFTPESSSGALLDDYIAGRTPPTGRTFYGSANAWGGEQLSALHNNKKAIWYLVTDHIDYYDLDRDPGEKASSPNDNLIMAFDGSFLDYTQSVPKRKIEAAKLDDKLIRRLQSIGYLQGVETAPPQDEKD